MSLKSIRDSYSKLINAFTEAGVTLNESQKASLDSFIVALEEKMSKQKEATIKATKKIVTEHLESEYKKVFESILKHQAENAELASKLQEKVQSLKENKKLARKVSNYLDLYLEKVLPEKKIVDYDRLQKLEESQSKLRDMLLVDDDAVVAKKAELTESFNKDKKALETQIAKLQVKLNESMANEQKLNAKIEAGKAKELLESKIKDLPTAEARKLKKRFAESTCEEIENNFTKQLESVESEVAEESKIEETTLEEEIKDIIDSEEDLEKTEKPVKPVKSEKPVEKKETETDESYETVESYKYDSEGNMILDESDIIDEDYMKQLCIIAERIK